MSAIKTGHTVHDATVNAAEAVRQSAAAGATQAAATSADIVFYRAARASAITNGISPSAFTSALKELGTGGG